MTKSRPSATKLRLSKLFRWLAVICLIKLSILGLVMLDIPVPFLQWQSESVQEEHTADPAAQALADAATASAPEQEQASPSTTGTAHAPVMDMPQGAEAARLAAAAPPQSNAAASYGSTVSAAPEFTAKVNPAVRTSAQDIPAPVAAQPVDKGTDSASVAASEALTVPGLPELSTPPPLQAPLAQAGVPAPLPAVTADPAPVEKESSLLDVLGLTALPVPAFGSVQAAHAASLDMPIPKTTTASSPFAPAAQLSPTSTGLPELPKAAPQAAGGAARPRDTSRDLPNLPALPQGAMPALSPAPAPAAVPQVESKISPDDPNEKAQELARQQQDILMLRRQMDERLQDLESAEKKVQDMIREAKGLEDAKVRRLIQMYANMKPRMAAKALENMDERVAVRILTGMAPKQSGEILTYTNPAKTAKFTELITRMRLPD